MIGEEETRKRIREWMKKDLGPAWEVVSIARYEKCYVVTEQETEPEATLHNLEKPWLPIQPGEEF